MSDTVRVTLIANAGLLLEYRGTTLLLDGIYGAENHPFSPLPPQLWNQMKSGTAPFEKIDLLLFSHLHPDHFSPEMTLEYLRSRPVRGIFLPDVPEVRDSGLIDYLTVNNIPCAALSKQTERMGFRITPEITVRTILTRHLDKRYEAVRHICYLISFGPKTLLFTADLDYVTENLDRLANTKLDAVFVNPLFFGALRRGKYFSGKLNTNHIVVYHVPFSDHDRLGIRKSLSRDLEQWPHPSTRTDVLQEPLQQLLIECNT